jgi:protein deglycase
VEQNMTKALVILAEGFEEIEAVTVVDVLRRADVVVSTAALTEKLVIGAHGIVVAGDCLLDDIFVGVDDLDAGPGPEATFDAVVLPGGMPGARHLRDDARVLALLVRQSQAGRLVGAICAAPIVLEAAGILNGRLATSYPGFALASAQYQEDRVVVDGNIVTSRGPGTALEFALMLVQRLRGDDTARQLHTSMVAR